MKKDNKYEWKYCSIGGVVRVRIESGEDIAHLRELDQKLWTVLSCPVGGLEFDGTTLKMIDADGDGKIRVNEVVSAAEWLTSVVKDKNSILAGSDSIALSNINVENETGKALHDSAARVLANLGLEKDSISVADTADSVAIFAKTQFNGDGVITPASADTDDLKALITTVIEKTPAPVADRSGVNGVNAEQIEQFYASCADYSAWQAAAEADKANVFPYGDNTAAALAAVDALKDKVSDYFMRCKLIGFDAAAAPAVDVSVEKITAIAADNLAAKAADIASCPLARPTADAVLPFNAINPAWQAAFSNLKALVLDVDFAGKDAINESEWNAVVAKFGPYAAWNAAKKGAQVESLGLDAVNAILKADAKAALLELVEKDKAVAPEADAIDQVNKLTHLFRDFYGLLCNYVTMTDFYARKRAVFEVGQLYIDQRCCDLCLKVEDMGQHANMAGLSGMFLIYCTCTSKKLGKSMNVVAVMTDGNVKELRPGKNAIFYDRNGQDWDAVVTKVVDNPISIKEAFWSPYRKLANTVTDRINKSAAAKESKVNSDMTAAGNNVQVPANAEAGKAAVGAVVPKQSFDIAKFAGIFAAIGMALGMIGSAVMALITPWYNILILFVVLVVCISGPSMFLAWQKLRKRNLGPVLNANGWAINSVILVNVLFGAKLTSVAKYPKVRMKDPYKQHTPWWKTALWIIVLLAAAFAALYFTNCLKCVGLPHEKAQEEVAAEVVAAETEAAAQAPAETAVVEVVAE